MTSTIALVIVFLSITAAAAFQFKKGVLIRATLTIFTLIAAIVVAFSFFEQISQLAISRANPQKLSIMLWLQPAIFALLFVIAFAIFQTAALLLMKQPIIFGDLPDKIGRTIAGVIIGYIIAGVILTTLVIAPLPLGWPYPRFSESPAKNDPPKKAFLNPDGFVTGLYSLVSKGAFANSKSFAAVYPAFLDARYLARIGDTKAALPITSREAIGDCLFTGNAESLSRHEGPDGKLMPQNGHVFALLTVTLPVSQKFTPAQARLMCKEKTDLASPMTGRSNVFYPVGIIDGKRFADKHMTDIITLPEGRDKIRLVYEVPNALAPALFAYKLNNLAAVRTKKPSQPGETEQLDAAEDIFPAKITNAGGATEVTPTSARLNGQVVSTGGDTPNVNVYYGENDGGQDSINWDSMSGMHYQSGTFYLDVNDLKPDTKYYYRCYGSNSAGICWSEEAATFTTPSE